MFLPSLLPFGILVTGLIGSAHCAGMCGPLVLASTKTLSERILYNIGRLAGYLLLGFLMGAFGYLVFQHSILKFQIIFGVGIGILLLAIGLKRILFSSNSFVLSSGFSRFLIFCLTKLSRLPVSIRFLKALGIGFVTAFLPCGFLYSVVIGSILTESPAKGAFLLFLFWLGTLPVMVMFPAILSKLLGSIRWISPRVVSILFILIGIFVVYVKMQGLVSGDVKPHCCKHSQL